MSPVDLATGEPQQPLPNPVDSRPKPNTTPAPEAEAPAPEAEAPAPEAPVKKPAGKSAKTTNVVRRIQRSLSKGKPVSTADIQMMRDVLPRDYKVKFTDPKTGEKRTVTLHSLERRKTNRENYQHKYNTIASMGFMSDKWGNFDDLV